MLVMMMMMMNSSTWQERLYARPTVKKFHSLTIEALTGGTARIVIVIVLMFINDLIVGGTANCYDYKHVYVVFLCGES